MTLHSLLDCYCIINDETRIGIIIKDRTTGRALRQLSGQWFEDHILRCLDYEVERFTYWTERNHMIVTMFEEDSQQ